MPDEIPKVWGLVAPLLRPALELDGGYTMGDLREKLEAGEGCHLWIAGHKEGDDHIADAAAVCLLLKAPRRYTYRAWLCGGEGLDCCRVLMDRIKEYATREGCTEVDLAAAPSRARAWGRVLPGFEEGYTVMRCKL